MRLVRSTTRFDLSGGPNWRRFGANLEPESTYDEYDSPDTVERHKRITRYQRDLEEQNKIIEQRNADITQVDDPLRLVSSEALIDTFAANRNAASMKILEVLMAETAQRSSLPDVEKIMGSVIGSSAKIRRANEIFEMIDKLHSLKLLQTMSDDMGLEESIRERLIDNFIVREWGPKPQPPPQINVGNNSPVTMSSGQNERKFNRGTQRSATAPKLDKDEPKQQSVGRKTGVQPFGNI